MDEEDIIRDAMHQILNAGDIIMEHDPGCGAHGFIRFGVFEGTLTESGRIRYRTEKERFNCSKKMTIKITEEQYINFRQNEYDGHRFNSEKDDYGIIQMHRNAQ